MSSRFVDLQAEVIKACGKAEALPLIKLAAGDDVQGLGLDSILHGCQFFVLSGGTFAYALLPAGRELWIQAAGGKDAQDLTRLGLAAIEAQGKAARFESVGFQTRRKGLVKKAQALGYEIDGFILRKKIK